MATSSVPTVKSQLLTTLQGAAALSGVQVTYSHPGDAEQDESVFLGDTTAGQDLPTMRAGRRTRAETVTVKVHCNARKPGDDAQGAESRAFELAAAVEDALADDATLSNTASVAAKVLSLESVIFLDGERGWWGCQVTVEVEVQTRLS